MMYHVTIYSPHIEIQTSSIQELEHRLGFLNPLCLSRINSILKSKYGLSAHGSGEKLKCIPCIEPNPCVDVIVVFPNGQRKRYSIEPTSVRSIEHV